MNLRSLFLTAAASSAALLAGVSCGTGGSSGGFNSGGLVTIVTTSVPSATTGVAYVAQLNANVPNAPGTFHVVSGLLPTGLSLDAATGIITGYPRQVGVFRFEVAARDGVDLALPPGRDTNFSEARQTFTIDVARGLPRILPQTLSTAVYRQGYLHTIDVAGGTAPYTFAQVGGTLPSGVTVSSDGHVGAFPTQYQVAPYSFVVQVTDAQGLVDTATLELTVVIKPLIILTTAISGAARFFPYSVPIELASSGGGAPYTWSQVAPGFGETDLASIGMAVTPDGRISDTGGGPLALGTFLFTVRVIDEAGQSATRQFSLTVNPGPVLTLINPKFASQAGTFTATGLNFQSGARLVLKPGTGEVSFTPTFVNSTTLTFPSTFPKPSPAAGPIDVKVVNPDGGHHTLPAALVLPAANINFGNKGFVGSALSSTGLDVADVNADGFADIVHCGYAGMQVFSGSSSSTNAGLVFLRNLGTPTPTFAVTTLDSGSYLDVRFVDVNVDGRLDIVALGQTTIRTWLGNGAGTFTVGTTSTLSGPGAPQFPSEMAFGFFNSDAIPDVAFGVPHFNWITSNVSGRMYWMAGNGSGGFTNLDSSVSGIANTYGVLSVETIDADSDGRAELVAGVGMNPYTGPAVNVTTLTSSGTMSSGFSARGGTMGPPYYGSTNGLAKGDFLGNGGVQLVHAHSGSPTYSNIQTCRILSGSTLGSELTLAAPGVFCKCITAVDGDFDQKLDWAITSSLNPGQIIVYRGSTQAVVLTLDPSVGSPSISSPRTGRIRAGDLNGDGMPDLVATTSYWQVNGMAANYGSSYQNNAWGNGGSMGVVWYLNTSN